MQYHVFGRRLAPLGNSPCRLTSESAPGMLRRASRPSCGCATPACSGRASRLPSAFQGRRAICPLPGMPKAAMFVRTTYSGPTARGCQGTPCEQTRTPCHHRWCRTCRPCHCEPIGRRRDQSFARRNVRGPSPRSACIHVHPPTLDMLEKFGVVGPMIEQGLICPTWQFRDRDEGVVADVRIGAPWCDTSIHIGCSASSGASAKCFTRVSGGIRWRRSGSRPRLRPRRQTSEGVMLDVALLTAAPKP